MDQKYLSRSMETIKAIDGFKTDKFKTLYSNWTPKMRSTSNRNIYDERVELILNWFDMWSNKQKTNFISKIFKKCNDHQFGYVQSFVHENVPVARTDFAKVLPRNISLKIFSYLDPKSLSRASQVSWHWKFISEQDELWIPKCKVFGWYLPYTPAPSEYGAWKQHYISNAVSIGFSVSSSKKEKIWRKYSSLDKNIVLMADENQTLNSLKDLEKYEKLVNRSVWKPTNAFPDDIENGRKALFLGLNPNQTLKNDDNSVTTTNKFGQIDKSRRLQFAKQLSVYTHQNSFTRSTSQIPLADIIAFMDIQPKQEEENPPMGFDLIKAGDLSPAIWQQPTLKNIQQIQNNIHGYLGWENPRVIFISSKLPAAELLIDSVLFGVILIAYNYEACSLKSLIYHLESILQGRLAKSIGLIGHRNSENEMWLVKNKCLSRRNLQDDKIKDFLEGLARNTLPQNKNGHVDLFAPFAAFEAGLDMLNSIKNLTNCTFSASSNPLGKFKHIFSEWYQIDTKLDGHPSDIYFNKVQLVLWIEYSDLFDEITTSTSQFIQQKYPRISGIFVSKLIARIVLENTMLKENIDQANLVIFHLSKCEKGNFIQSLKDAIVDLEELSCSDEPDHTKFENNDEYLEDFENDDEEIKMKRKTFESFNVTERNTKINLKVNLRKQIAREISLQINKMLNYLNIIRNMYFVPLKKAALSIRPILNESNIKIIFADILLFIPPMEYFIDHLQSRLYNWTVEQCLGDLFETLSKDLITIFKSFFLSYPNSLLLIERCRETNPKFREMLNALDFSAETCSLSLTELFYKPLDMVPDLMNLLHWIMANTSDDNIDNIKLRLALGFINKINKIIIQEKSRIDNSIKLNYVENLIIGCPLINSPGRTFVTQSVLKLYNCPANDGTNDFNKKIFYHIEDCGIFVFNDCLIFTRVTSHPQPFNIQEFRKFTFEHALSIAKVAMFDLPDRKDVKFGFQIRYGNRKWNLGANSVEEKYNLTEAIRKYVELSVNQHIGL